MLNSAEYRELRNGKRFYTSRERTMRDHGSMEENATEIPSENVEGKKSEIQTLTQETVNEQIRGFKAPLIRPLEELTRLVQGLNTRRHPNYYPGLSLVPLLVEPLISPTLRTSIKSLRNMSKNSFFGTFCGIFFTNRLCHEKIFLPIILRHFVEI